MAFWRSTEEIGDDVGLNMDLAKEAIGHYSRVAGVGISIIDSRGKPLYSVGYTGLCCKFCSEVRDILDTEKDYCDRVHLYGGYQSERFGVGIFSSVPWVWHIGLRLFRRRMVRGYLLCGPVLIDDTGGISNRGSPA